MNRGCCYRQQEESRYWNSYKGVKHFNSSKDKNRKLFKLSESAVQLSNNSYRSQSSNLLKCLLPPLVVSVYSCCLPASPRLGRGLTSVKDAICLILCSRSFKH